MNLKTPSESGAPRQLFFTTPEQRIALARQRFFEEGVRPSGLVAEPVIQSWMRCTSARARVSGELAFDPVTPSRLHGALNRNRELLAAARLELLSIENSLAGTDCRVLLTDGEGVIVHATHNPQATQAPILHRAGRLGVNISEGVVGTSAPGIVTKTGQASMVRGAEHFFDCLQQFQCAAAPIRDVHGRLAGVLNLSVESRHFGFDAASVIGLYATSIENRLLQSQSRDHLLLRFQASPALLSTPMEALAGIAAGGTVAWLNDIAARLLGNQPQTLQSPVEAVFGLHLEELVSLVRCEAAQQVRLPSGLCVWVSARLSAADGINFNHALATAPAPPSDVPVLVAPVVDPEPLPAQTPVAAMHVPADATLGQHSRKIIEATLLACGGNIAKAARILQVSRGTLYRRLRDWRAEPDGSTAV